MDFSLPDDVAELVDRTRRFVRERVLPYENDPPQTARGPSPELRRGCCRASISPLTGLYFRPPHKVYTTAPLFDQH